MRKKNVNRKTEVEVGLSLKEIIKSDKEREQLTKKLYLGEIFDIEKPELSSNNLILAPVGSGKSSLIEDRLIPRDYTGTVLYLVSNTALKDSIAPEDSELREYNAKNGKYKGFFTSQNKDTFGEVPYKVHVMTYHEFGIRLYSPNEDFSKDISLIFCDEIHSLPIFTQYAGGNTGEITIALRWLFQKYEDKTIYYFTATREGIDYLEQKSPGYTKNAKVFDYLDYPNIVKYQAKSTYYISNIQQLRIHLRARRSWVEYNLTKGLAFTRRIENEEKIAKIAIEEGYCPLILWSVNNEEKELTQQQAEARMYLLRTGKIPEPYDLLIINGSMQEGWNLLDEKVEFAILDTLNETEKIQALGRIRKDIDFLVLKTNDKELVKDTTQAMIVLDKKYLNKELYKKEKDEVSKSVSMTSEKGVLLKWPTVKRMLISSGYKIEDKIKKSKGVRRSCSIITD